MAKTAVLLPKNLAAEAARVVVLGRYLCAVRAQEEKTAMDFDQIIPRDHYPTLKWNKRRLTEHFGNDEAYPFWVADMDFRAPDAVIESLLKRAEHGIYG